MFRPISDITAAAIRLRLTTGSAIAVGGLSLAVLTALAIFNFQFHLAFAVTALSLYLAIGAIVLVRIPGFHPHARFGEANAVTLARAVVVCLFGGLVVLDGPWNIPGWWLVGLAVLVLALDGIDGWLARRSGLSSRFGARFDMEVDALFLLILSLLALGLYKVGPWVVLIGALRYLFVAASIVLPWLRAPLPPSLRRKAVCVVQGVVLVVCLAPIVEPPLSSMLAGVALAALIWSFAVDIWFLYQRRMKGLSA